MKQPLIFAIPLSLTVLIPAGLQPVIANELHIGAAYSTDQLRGARFGYRSASYTIEGLNWAGAPTLSVESAFNHWQDSNNTADNISAISVSPILSWRLTDGAQPVYLEAGVGASYIDKTEIGDRRLSTRFQFEDRVGVSWQYSPESEARVSFQYTHYSNADIDKPNDGLDFYSVYWVIPL